MEYNDKHILRTFDVSEQLRIRQSLEKVEDLTGIEYLSENLFALLNELISNGIKANMKRVFFLKDNYDLTDPKSIEKGQQKFRTIFPKIYKMAEYRAALTELNLAVTVLINLNRERLLIFIENNSLFSEKEELRIREKLGGAMKMKDLVQFSSEFGDDAEGEGLGLAMVIQLMKHLGFDPAFFRIYSESDRTIARLELPLQQGYTPLRDQN